MSQYQFIDLQDGNMAIGLSLQDNYTLLLEVRNYDTHQINEKLTGTITSISDGMLYTTLGPFERYVRHEVSDVWQNMDVITHEENKHFYDELEKAYPDHPYWYLMKTKTGQFCIGSHVGPCNPMPFFYLENPNDLTEFIQHINL